MGEYFLGGRAVAVALCASAVACWAGYLCWWDVRHQRLPDYLTLPGAAVMLVAGLVANPVAVVVGLVWPTLIALVALLSRGSAAGIGGGDLKLSISLGIAAAMAGGIVGVLAAILLSNMITVLLAAARRVSTLPHGPSMLAAVAAVTGMQA